MSQSAVQAVLNHICKEGEGIHVDDEKLIDATIEAVATANRDKMYKVGFGTKALSKEEARKKLTHPMESAAFSSDSWK